MENLKEEILKALREKGFIAEEEVAYKQGDLLIAENVVSNQKRMLTGVPKSLLENAQRRILKG